ncbi:right-handed parallel beta-helix repeat-containing protein [Streptomyces sp. B1866]|uniref:right-handed parallel beta-helix repeat-containing protein n=1 Tax=Streptomyces sp. B1866 TaxID=3075431 RepID=UPI00288E4A55|nr:right-handed parallel beta-helix repeat-containing protein [Streptomyces sp. B1866]MDT3397265.1 right-handed parallel beta-helix repeat-containing protein [Streptomyces sp. B1866]
MMTAQSILAGLATVITAVAGPSPTASGAPSAACTRHMAAPGDAGAARPGDVVCLDRDLSADRLVITRGGTRDKPVTYTGGGATVGGITVEADHVVVEGYRVDRPHAPGVELTGQDITLRDTVVSRPRGGDGDGIRFFGDGIRIVGNTVTGTDNRYGHADCMQTFADDTPASRGVVIEGNRCEQIDNMCLMAEGPDDGEGDGHGVTSGFVVKDNYCETLVASQALMFEDVQDATITGNTFAAPTHHAIGLAVHSTGAHVGGNTLNPRIRYEVGIDASSRPGYQGPEPGGAP